MFWRLVFQLLRRSRGRFAVAIFAIVSGATVISALLNLDLGVQNKLTQEFRTLGANIVISPASGAPAQITGAEVPSFLPERDVLAATAMSCHPRRFERPRRTSILWRSAQNIPVVVAGTWLDQAPKLDATWKLEGNWIASRADDSHMFGRPQCCATIASVLGNSLGLHYRIAPRSAASLELLSAGGAEDNQIFANLRAVQAPANLPDQSSRPTERGGTTKLLLSTQAA